MEPQNQQSQSEERYAVRRKKLRQRDQDDQEQEASPSNDEEEEQNDEEDQFEDEEEEEEGEEPEYDEGSDENQEEEEEEEVEEEEEEDDNQASRRAQQKHIKQEFVTKLKQKAPKSQPETIEEQMEELLRQAEYYANFLLAHHEVARNRRREGGKKKRGHFDQQQQQQKHLIQQQQLEQGSYTHLSQQPSLLTGGQLKFYQMVGLNWLISLYEGGINGILADDMGLGKTIQTISMIAFLKQFKRIKGPHLIVAPKITLGNWMREFAKWMPCARVVKLVATREERTVILEESIRKRNFDVVVTSFEGVRFCLKDLRKIRWKTFVIDEAHKIKNQESMLSRVVRALHTGFKVLLTGTPLQNNLHELWSLLNFILPDIFDSSQVFDEWFQHSNNTQVPKQQKQQQNVQMIQQLHKILKPFMLRRTKKQVQKSLPQKKQIHIYVGLTQAQIKLYKNLLQHRVTSDDQKKMYLNLIMQLRKVCNHPYLFPGIQQEGAPALGEHIVKASGKMIVLDQLLRKLAMEKHQVLIFSQMTMVLDILEDYCNFRGYKYCRIDGSTEMDSRDNQINAFMEEDSDRFVFLLSTRAGGLGINLTAADTVVIYDSDWNPQMDLQAMDRAHRIGQKSCVNVYRMITENTVEEKMIERQTIKLKWDSLVIQQGRMNSQKNKALSRDQMKDMLQFGANAIFKADSGTISEERIEELLSRGESKTQQLNQAIEEKVKSAALDLGMSSINIFDCFLNANKEDAEAMDQVMARQLQGQVRARRTNNISKQPGTKLKKKVQLPQHHFYSNRDVLTQLLQKQQDGTALTQQQAVLKKDLIKTGFIDWSRQDVNNFVHGCEKFGKNSIKEIADFISRPLQEVTRYSQVFWLRLDELPEGARIRKAIEQGEERMANRKHHNELLDWKYAQGKEIDFNNTVYTKFRSKLFTLQADKFLVHQLHKLHTMSRVRDLIRTESMFRFDHFFRSRTESQLNKRMLSLYKLIEKEKDIAINGVDTTVLKDREQKKQKKAQKAKAKEAELAARSGADIMKLNDGSKSKENKPSQKQKKIDIITIDEDESEEDN